MAQVHGDVGVVNGHGMDGIVVVELLREWGVPGGVEGAVESDEGVITGVQVQSVMLYGYGAPTVQRYVEFVGCNLVSNYQGIIISVMVGNSLLTAGCSLSQRQDSVDMIIV